MQQNKNISIFSINQISDKIARNLYLMKAGEQDASVWESLHRNNKNSVQKNLSKDVLRRRIVLPAQQKKPLEMVVRAQKCYRR